MDIKTMYSQVAEMTDEEKIKMYSKFSKAELIKMLIESNRFNELLSKNQTTQFSFTGIIPKSVKCILHNWLPIPSPNTAINKWQCLKCGEIKESSGSDCFTTTIINET